MQRFDRILVGLDRVPGTTVLCEGSRGALLWARWLASQDRARITLVHSTAGACGPLPPAPSGSPFEEALESLRAAGVEARLSISEAPATLALLEHARAEGSDLVLVGKRAAPFLQGPLLGSVTTRLVRECPCAVWVVKPGAPPPPLRILLAAADRSPVGERVLDVAGGLATRSGAALHVVHTFQLTPSVQLGRDEDAQHFAARTREERIAWLRERLAAAGAPADARLHVALSSPTQAVLECEERYAPELVVMGTIARGGVAGLLVGNTAERLLARLETSLLTLKPEDFPGTAADSSRCARGRERRQHPHLRDCRARESTVRSERPFDPVRRQIAPMNARDPDVEAIVQALLRPTLELCATGGRAESFLGPDAPIDSEHMLSCLVRFVSRGILASCPLVAAPGAPGGRR